MIKYIIIIIIIIIICYRSYNLNYTDNNIIKPYKINDYYLKKNRLSDNQNTYNNIPLKAYTYWHSKDILHHMYNTLMQNIDNNPEIDFYIFDEIQSRDFIKKNFNGIVFDTYNNLLPDAYKSDLFRYCLLYINGGIYFDIKFKFNVPIIKLIAKYNSIFVQDFNHCDNATINGFIITEQKNPIFMDCINQIIYNVNNNIYGKNALFPTGPCLLGSISKKYNIIYKLKIHNSTNNNYVITDYYNEDDIILTPYPEYRFEQEIMQNKMHYSKLWNNINIYSNKLSNLNPLQYID